MHHRISSGVVLLAAGFAIVACISSDKSAAKTDSAAPAAAAAAPSVVTIHAKDNVFDTPAEASAGMITFNLVNDGPGIHHATVVRLDSGKTVADLQAALKALKPNDQPPRWMVPVGGPNAPAPMGQSNATLNLDAGNYAFICFVDLPDGVPHFAKGMVHAFTVKPAAGAVAAAPTSDVTITLTDYTVTESKPLSAGKHTFEVRNTAAQWHEMEIIKLAAGKTSKQLLDWMAKPAGPPPGNAVGGMAPMSPGGPAYFTADITPGNYLVICFVPDAKDGKPHFMKGMMKTETVN